MRDDAFDRYIAEEESMNFSNPIWLIGLLLIPIGYYLFTVANKKKKSEALKFSNISFIKSSAKKSNRLLILFVVDMIILGFIFIALADPMVPLQMSKKGVNVILAIDVSGSMMANDYKPTRLDAAKQSAETLLSELLPNDYAGLVTFESGATTAAYLSPNKQRVIDKLRNIQNKEGRTAIGDGLGLAIDMAISIPNKKNVVILLSDGVNNAGVISPEEAIAFAKSNEIKVFTIGLGSEGKTVLGYDWFGNPQYAELDEQVLKTIAENTGGQYFKSVDEKTLKDIYSQLGKQIKREKEDTSIKDWFLYAMIILVMIEFYFRFGKERIIQ